MTRNRGISNRQHGASDSDDRRPVRRSPSPPITPLPNQPSSQAAVNPRQPPAPPPSQNPTRQRRGVPPSPPLRRVPPAEAAPRGLQRTKLTLLAWFSKWQFWALLSLCVTTGMGAASVAVLFELPSVPNCPAIFWPIASASLRLHCAQIAANKQTIRDLLEAIALVNNLPADHPLRPEIDRLVEQWSQDILRLADETFNAGQLSDAIAAARRIPTSVSAYQQVEDKIQKWQQIWNRAEAIYQQSENELRKQNFRQAFVVAVKLLSVGNTYWETTKYQELSNAITTAREDGNKLVKARGLADEGGVSGVVAAIKLVQGVGKNSYAYQEAQKLVVEFSRKLLTLAQGSLERRDLQGALSILDKIPDGVGLDEEAKDFADLARAQAQAWSDSPAALQEAIGMAQKLTPGRPLYDRAQKLIARWQLEIGDVTQLAQARQLAAPGTTNDLAAAIAEAGMIPSSNPRWQEAQQQIQRWKSQIETMEDRPVLDQAEQLAKSGDINSLQAAIEQAKQVKSGRALSGEAQGKIQTWTSQIQRIQDQPYLDQAQALANAGNFADAIAQVQQIQSGRALYDEAQQRIRNWRAQIQGQEKMREASQLANSESPEALAAAIQAASQVSEGSSLRNEAVASINQWSKQLLTIAQTQAQLNLPGAIAIAQKIPTSSEVYGEAQQQIQEWKRQMSLGFPTGQ